MVFSALPLCYSCLATCAPVLKLFRLNSTEIIFVVKLKKLKVVCALKQKRRLRRKLQSIMQFQLTRRGAHPTGCGEADWANKHGNTEQGGTPHPFALDSLSSPNSTHVAGSYNAHILTHTHTHTHTHAQTRTRTHTYVHTHKMTPRQYDSTPDLWNRYHALPSLRKILQISRCKMKFRHLCKIGTLFRAECTPHQ